MYDYIHSIDLHFIRSVPLYSALQLAFNSGAKNYYLLLWVIEAQYRRDVIRVITYNYRNYVGTV